MSAIFSVQNLQTFLRRKNLRPPSRGGPPGPARSPPPPPPKRGGPPPHRGPPPAGRDGRSANAAGALVSSVINAPQSVASGQLIKRNRFNWPLITDHWPPSYAVAGVSAAGGAGASSATAARCAVTFFL